MPHDLQGNLLKEGDYVWIPAVVKSITTNEDYCNCTCDTTEFMYPGNSVCTIVLNAKQVLKAQRESSPLKVPEAIDGYNQTEEAEPCSHNQ